jgi:hypothetical protein
MERVDSLLQELSSRHHNRDPRFLAAVRPLVVNILDARTPDHSRVALLELLAETFERDRQVRDDCASAKAAWQELFANLKRLLGLG